MGRSATEKKSLYKASRPIPVPPQRLVLMGSGDKMAGTCSRLPNFLLLEILIGVEIYLNFPICRHDVVFN